GESLSEAQLLAEGPGAASGGDVPRAADSLARQLDAAFAALTADTRRVVAARALGLPAELSSEPGGDVPIVAPERLPGCRAEGQAGGWLGSQDGDDSIIASELHAAAARRALDTAPLRPLLRAARRLLVPADGGPAHAPLAAEVLLAAGDVSGAVTLWK